MPFKVPATIRGLLCVFGGFLIQLVVGSFHGTFGNMLPYLTSYRRQTNPELTNGDLAVLLPGAGITQGFVFTLSGFFLVPLIGCRACLIFGCLSFVASPILGYLVIDMPIPLLTLCLGSLAGIGLSTVIIPVMLIPVTWFPNKRGTVVGFIAAGFGLASTVFTPLQTFIINPDNVLPVLNTNNGTNSTEKYFEDPEVLERVPVYLLYISTVYGILSLIGIILCVEKPKESDSSKIKEKKVDVIKNSFKFLWREGFTNRDFYLLWLTRYMLLVVCGGILSHWKSFGLQLNPDDRQISIVGGVNGILNSVSRIITGALMDKLSYRVLMPTICAVLSLALVCIFWVGHAAFEGYYALIWLAYLLSFSHFASVPTQAIKLFQSQSSIILGAIGLSDSASYFTVAILNMICFSTDTPLFMPFFVSLSVFAGLSVIITALVREPKLNKNEKEEMKIEDESYMNTAYSGKVNSPIQLKPKGLII